MEGIHGITPCIKKVVFNERGKMKLQMKDGRELIVPVRMYPSIQKLSDTERKKYTIVNDQMVMFQNSTTVYHLQDFFGTELEYRYQP
jgi:hypothetical protein